jgi:hypothetical protein
MRIQITVIIAAAAIALSACGNDTKDTATPTPASSAGDTEASVMQQLSKCYREHGAPSYPDPVQNSDGTWGVPGQPADPPASAHQACASIEAKLPQVSDEKPLSAADMSKMRQFATCMREHGLTTWPDPQPDGSFKLPQTILQGGKQAFMTQANACRQYMVGGHLKAVPA